MITLMKLERSLSSKQLVRSRAAASCPTQPCNCTPSTAEYHAALPPGRPEEEVVAPDGLWGAPGEGSGPPWGGGLGRAMDSGAEQLFRILIGQPLTLDLSFPVCEVGVGHLAAFSPRSQSEVPSPLGTLLRPCSLGQRPPQGPLPPWPCVITEGLDGYHWVSFIQQIFENTQQWASHSPPAFMEFVFWSERLTRGLPGGGDN